MTQTSVMNFIGQCGVFVLEYGWSLLLINAVLMIVTYYDWSKKTWRDTIYTAITKTPMSEAEDTYHFCAKVGVVWMIIAWFAIWFTHLPIGR